MQYTFISDPGHGWLKVPLADLPTGFEPSFYSFKDKHYAYLEEDCDAGAFLKAIAPIEPTIKEEYVENFNREMARFGT